MNAQYAVLLGLAGFAAGVVNAIAGGGSLISFPALLFTGMPPVVANATNTVAIWPGTVSSTWAYRRYIAEEKHRAWVLAWPSLIGGLAGSVLLLHTPESAFRAVVPWLILFAAALLAAQGPVARWVSRAIPSTSTTVPPALWLAQLAISVYGGYFGAGIGILMLAAMAIFLPDTLQHANALKVLFSLLINGIAAVYFLVAGSVRLPEAALMMVAAVVGGWAGAHLAQRLPAWLMRLLVIAFAVAVAAKLLWKG
ncbi:MAG TPA: sulfite exporter TauE/SafE family protein [Anaeromyxobacteraceae bacterium]|nr:sulfite exporter TauE/SafE family protein [Anaeromyxobacteraceae bacterium]